MAEEAKSQKPKARSQKAPAENPSVPDPQPPTPDPSSLVTIYVMGEAYKVPKDLTIMKAME